MQSKSTKTQYKVTLKVEGDAAEDNSENNAK